MRLLTESLLRIMLDRQLAGIRETGVTSEAILVEESSWFLQCGWREEEDLLLANKSAFKRLAKGWVDSWFPLSQVIIKKRQ